MARSRGLGDVYKRQILLFIFLKMDANKVNEW
jgi:hypothetical protein